MNFRGSDGYDKTFKETGRDDWVVMQEDVEDGARWFLKGSQTQNGCASLVGHMADTLH